MSTRKRLRKMLISRSKYTIHYLWWEKPRQPPDGTQRLMEFKFEKAGKGLKIVVVNGGNDLADSAALNRVFEWDRANETFKAEVQFRGSPQLDLHIGEISDQGIGGVEFKMAYVARGREPHFSHDEHLDAYHNGVWHPVG
ncbi:MAG: hypothetical protein AAGA95_00510 [Pseudomonadota bacterium]